MLDDEIEALRERLYDGSGEDPRWLIPAMIVCGWFEEFIIGWEFGIGIGLAIAEAFVVVAFVLIFYVANEKSTLRRAVERRDMLEEKWAAEGRRPQKKPHKRRAAAKAARKNGRHSANKAA